MVNSPRNGRLDDRRLPKPESNGGRVGGPEASRPTIVGGKATVNGKAITTKIVKDGPNSGWKANVTAANGGGTVHGKTRLEVANAANAQATRQNADRAKSSAEYKAKVDDHNKLVGETKWSKSEGGNANVARWGKGHAPDHATGKAGTIRMKDGNGVVEVTRQKNGIRISSKVGGFDSNERFIQGTGTKSVESAFAAAKLMQAGNASKDSAGARRENERAYGIRDQASAKNPAAAKYQGQIQKGSDLVVGRDGTLKTSTSYGSSVPANMLGKSIGTVAKVPGGYTATVEGVTVTSKTKAGAVTAIVRKIKS